MSSKWPQYPRAARTFAEAYANTDYRLPLTGEQLDAFYVSRSDRNSRLELLEQELLLGVEKELNTKFLLSGHVGCGKSTELNRSVKEIEENDALREGLFVVPYSINEVLDLQGVDYTDIAFSIVVGVYSRLEQLDLTFDEKHIEEVTEWIGKEVEQFTTSILGGEVELETLFGLPRILGYLNLLGIRVRGGGARGSEVRYKVKKRAPELRHLLNEMFVQLKALTGMNVLLVIDDLDKLPRREALRVFRDDGPFLALLDCMAIYTAPVSLMYELGDSPSFEPYRSYPVPMFKIAHREPEAGFYEPDINKMIEMIYRRVSPTLFTEGIVEQMVKISGGVARHLIKITQDACLYCTTFHKEIIDQEVFDWVIEEFKRDFSRRLTREDYARLKRIHIQKDYDDDDHAWEYLHSLCVLEYVNGDYWYDVHPAVQRLIAEREPIKV